MITITDLTTDHHSTGLHTYEIRDDNGTICTFTLRTGLSLSCILEAAGGAVWQWEQEKERHG